MAEINLIGAFLSAVIITGDRSGRGHPNTFSCYVVEGWSKECALLFKHLGGVSLKLHTKGDFNPLFGCIYAFLISDS